MDRLTEGLLELERMTASAVVLSHRRTSNLGPILDRLAAQGFVDDIVIWHNIGAEGRPLLKGPEWPEIVTVHNSQENAYTWGRFEAAAALCRHDTIVTQDDDVLPNNWRAIWQAWIDYKRAGIVAAMPRGHARLHRNFVWNGGRTMEVLLGWGSVFDRRWICPAFAPYLDRYGKDELLLRKADRLFSILTDRPHRILSTRGGADYVDLPGATTRALFQRSDHGILSKQARKRALELLATR